MSQLEGIIVGDWSRLEEAAHITDPSEMARPPSIEDSSGDSSMQTAWGSIMPVRLVHTHYGHAWRYGSHPARNYCSSHGTLRSLSKNPASSKRLYLIGEIHTKPAQGGIQQKPHTFTFAIDE